MLYTTNGEHVMRAAIRRAIGVERRFLAPPSLAVLEEMRCRIHANCLACGDPRFRLEYAMGPGETLIARFEPTEEHCSYAGVVHGGLLAMLADEAMTCCLLARGVQGVTGELKMRYLQGVEVGEIELCTRVTKVFAPLYHLECEMRQGGAPRVRGTGRFLQRTSTNNDNQP